jgi:hypothetical protein
MNKRIKVLIGFLIFIVFLYPLLLREMGVSFSVEIKLPEKENFLTR